MTVLRDRRPLRAVMGSVAAVAAGLVLVGCAVTATHQAPSGGGDISALDADALSRSFLEDWVDDGRVVRRDQGSDTVSEGQAYGLLVAAALGDEASFDAIWTWTSDNLVRPDGLLAWRWAEGAIVDDEPASDADLDVARALVTAGQKFGREDLASAGVELAETVLDELTIETELGRVLLPGLWAADTTPVDYNPSYASPGAFQVLGSASGDSRWVELADGSRAVTAALVAEGRLPSDWAQIGSDGAVTPVAGAQGDGDRVVYGYDAARTAIRYADSCDPDDVELAAGLADTLGQEPAVAAELDLGGAAMTGDDHPLAYLARGAAREAAGDSTGSRVDSGTAAALLSEQPTYYGAAWLALAPQLGRGGGLDPCQSDSGSSASGEASGFQDPVVDAVGASDAEPVRVRIPSIEVDSDLERLARDGNGEIEAPVDGDNAGWYEDGVVPGQKGPAVIAGHIDSRGGTAVFQRLTTLRQGDEILVSLSDGTELRFSMDSATQVPKEDFPTERIYGPTPTAQLRLVTCAGDWDDGYGSYLDNAVVFASLVA